MTIVLIILSSIVLIAITGCPRHNKPKTTVDIDKLPTKLVSEEKAPNTDIRNKVRPTKWMKTNWVNATNKTDFKAEYETSDKTLDDMYDYYDKLFDNWAQNIIEGDTFSVSMLDPDERVDIHGKLNDEGIIKWSLKYQKILKNTE